MEPHKQRKAASGKEQQETKMCLTKFSVPLLPIPLSEPKGAVKAISGAYGFAGWSGGLKPGTSDQAEIVPGLGSS